MTATVLWASRHPLDAEAEKALHEEVYFFKEVTETRELLWPSDRAGCDALWKQLLSEFGVVLGVFPAAAMESFFHLAEFRQRRVGSPVSQPTQEEVSKVRKFEFVRWAWF